MRLAPSGSGIGNSVISRTSDSALRSRARVPFTRSCASTQQLTIPTPPEEPEPPAKRARVSSCTGSVCGTRAPNARIVRIPIRSIDDSPPSARATGGGASSVQRPGRGLSLTRPTSCLGRGPASRAEDLALTSPKRAAVTTGALLIVVVDGLVRDRGLLREAADARGCIGAIPRGCHEGARGRRPRVPGDERR